MSSTLVLVCIFLIHIQFAQAAPSIELDSRNNYGEVSVKNIRVIEKEFYKVIVLNINFQAKDLELEHIISIYPDAVKLVNENGKLYFPERDECKMAEPLVKTPDGGPCYQVENECGKPVWWFSIKGTEGGIKNYHPCFRVEKEFSNFKIYYGHEKFGKSLSDSTQIGTINLNELNQQITKNNSDNISGLPKKSTDFFSQLMDMFRSWFNFS